MKKFKFYQEFPIVHVLQTPIEVEADSYEEAVKILMPYSGLEIGGWGYDKLHESITIDKERFMNDENEYKYEDTQEEKLGIPYIMTFSEDGVKIGDSISNPYVNPAFLNVVWSHKGEQISNCRWHFEQKAQAVESSFVVLRELAELEVKRGDLHLGLSDEGGVAKLVNVAMELKESGRCLLQHGDFSLSIFTMPQIVKNDTSDKVLDSHDALFIYDALANSSSNQFKK